MFAPVNQLLISCIWCDETSETNFTDSLSPYEGKHLCFGSAVSAHTLNYPVVCLLYICKIYLLKFVLNTAWINNYIQKPPRLCTSQELNVNVFFGDLSFFNSSFTAYTCLFELYSMPESIYNLKMSCLSRSAELALELSAFCRLNRSC